MKFVVALVLACVAVCMAAPAEVELVDGVVPVLRREESRDEFGQYFSEYLSGDGTQVQEQGELIPGTEGPVIARRGSYKYFTPEGELIELTYYADDTGFHAQGAHLPKVVEA